MPSAPLILRARYVLPVTGDPIPDGFVAIERERIAAVGSWRGVAAACNVVSESLVVRDLGNVAILPGLVNAHAHLDFSGLVAPLGHHGIGMVDWIRCVLDYRRQARGQERQAIARGLQESLRLGITTLADIAQPGWPLDALVAAPLRTIAFQELIAPTADRVADTIELARTHLRRVSAAACPNVAPGLSPHAPYTVHPDLLSAAIELSAAERIPMAMHLAETPEELELLAHGTGPLRQFLGDVGAWDATAIAGPTRPLDFLRLLSTAHRALVIHGNYLDDEEIGFLGGHAERMAVVYCPRSHDWFAHRRYPLEKMLAAGANVALGTDGRASSPDLSLLAEMRFAARRHPGVGLDQVLKLGTIDAARALGLENEIGSLTRGKRADLAIVALPDRDAADSHELVLHGDEPVVACYCGGREEWIT
jgi:aminodeoxyfutalosine deaminase